jgi:hypothetical protein
VAYACFSKFCPCGALTQCHLTSSSGGPQSFVPQSFVRQRRASAFCVLRFVAPSLCAIYCETDVAASTVCEIRFFLLCQWSNPKRFMWSHLASERLATVLVQGSRKVLNDEHDFWQQSKQLDKFLLKGFSLGRFAYEGLRD